MSKHLHEINICMQHLNWEKIKRVRTLVETLQELNNAWAFAHIVRKLFIKAYFFRVGQFALRIYKAILHFCNLRFKKNNRVNAQIAQTVFDYLPKCCNAAFVKVIVLKENVKKNRN